jgi:N-acetylmuramoyl-L-alanine amidase
MPRTINAIVIHCAASPNGVSLARRGHTAAQEIDRWHGERVPPFNRATWRLRTRPQFKHLGYHYVIDVDGTAEAGRELDEIGAHVAGHNRDTLGICLVGGDRFTAAQWVALRSVTDELLSLYPRARLCGHRDFSPDLNGDGRITSNEWIKNCPNFDVSRWVGLDRQALPDHLYTPVTEGAAP